MAILELFSTRQKKARGEVPDVFVYDQIPERLRVQIVHIIHDALGTPSTNQYSSPAIRVYANLVSELLRHFGRLTLAAGGLGDEQLANFLLSEPSVDACLDAVELSFRIIERFVDYVYREAADTKLRPAEAIADLNARFLEHGVGYQYQSGNIIRIDSQYLHSQVIKPALALLHDNRYHGANEEFLKAHEDYRKGDVKDCLANCLKAFESTLKTICDIRGWVFQKTDTAKTLLDICFKNDLVPPFLRAHYSALQSTLESGVPTLRNKLGGHGQGKAVVDVPPHYAAYALHITGSAIQFFVEAEKSISRP